MATITTRAGKGAALTHIEVDNNFTGLNTELGQKEVASNKGLASGYASLDAGGKVPSAQLPSYVDDVVEAANLASLPVTGETGKIYVTLDTNKTYRWSGSAYIEISPSPGSTDSLAEGSTNLYFTQARARTSLSASGSLSYNSGTGVISFTDAVTSVAGLTGAVTLTSSSVGLGNVENKSSATIRGEITSGNVTTALGFTPYNATNPSAYITSSSLSSYLPLSGGTLTGVLYTNGTSSALATSDHRRIMHPGGASYVTQTSSVTGAIKIKMPLLGSAMMMMATVRVYEYSTGKSFELVYGGHRDGSNWYNEFAYIIGDESRGDISVRFGIDGTSDCVWIGETNTVWSYPQVWVTDVQIGFAGYSANWHIGWSVSFVASFDTVNRTRTAFRKLTSSNYTSYAPSLTGTGASGTWAISVTGNAATATNSTQLGGFSKDYFVYGDTGNTGSVNTYIPDGGIGANAITRSCFFRDNESNFTALGIHIQHANNGGYGVQIGSNYAGTTWLVRAKVAGTWGSSATLLTSGNYTSYSPSLTGTGASGTWGINVTGTAGSISGYNNPTTAATANTIVYRDSGGDINGRYYFGVHFNQSSSNTENPSIGAFWTNSGSDNYNRKSSPAHVISQLALLTTGNYTSYAMPRSGSWLGDLASYSYTREHGVAMTGGSEFVILSKAGQGFTLVDGSYFAYEAGGFYSSNNSAGNTLLGFQADTTSSVNFNCILKASTDIRAPLFYDSNNTAYYLDPAGSSQLNTVYIANDIRNNTSVADNDTFGMFWSSDRSGAYGIFKEDGAWAHPFPDLRIAFHTGIKLGANASYQGIRFYTDYDMTSEVFSVNNGSSPIGAGHVYVNNVLQAGSSLRAPLFYDSENTAYFVDPASTGAALNIAGNLSLVARSSSWAEGIRIDVPSAGTWGGIRFTRNNVSGPGNWAIGYTGLNSSDDLTWYGGTNNLIQLNLDQSGNLTARGNVTAYGSPSDRRLKENIEPLSGALSKIMRLQGCAFRWKKDSPEYEIAELRNDVGFIADDVQEILPDMVRRGSDGYLSLRDRGFSAFLVEAVKEQQAQITAMSAEINSLKERLQ